MSTEKLIEYLRQDTEKKFDDIKDQLAGIDGKIDLLFKFKWQIIGGSAVMSLFITVFLKIILKG